MNRRYSKLHRQYTTDWGAIGATLRISILPILLAFVLPILLAFVLLSNCIVEGIAAGLVKDERS